MKEVREKKRVLIVGDKDSFSYRTIDVLRSTYDVTVVEAEPELTEHADLMLLDTDSSLGQSILHGARVQHNIPVISISESDNNEPYEQMRNINILHRLNKMWTSPAALLRVIAGVLS